MRVLVGNIPLPSNRFLVDLNSSIARKHALTHDHERFWNQDGDFDVVHLHFPEYMTEEIQQRYFDDTLDEAMFDAIEQRMRYWSSRAKIIFTRHVLLPHLATTNPLWERLYEMVYSYAHGFAHFAQPSIDEFNERYASTHFAHGTPQHMIVPHQNYTSLPNEISPAAARRQLGIPESAKVMLIFGAVRNDHERELILNTFRNIRDQNKFLLVSRWREKLAAVRWIRLKYWLRDATRLYYRLHPRYRFNYGFVEEADTQLYLNAADVLFIPRLWVLNSGNVTLGMTFGKVVVGPDAWDVGHLLKQTGNVVFDPDHPESAAGAMEQAFELADAGKVGSSNRELALSQWSSEQCADLYSELYERVISSH
jgi:glycosyltransferase involved in cell wall biosynthesis